MLKKIGQDLLRNWKTNLVAVISFVMAVPQAVTCIQAWTNHTPCNWRLTAVSLLVAFAAAFAKDSTNHSTSQEVQKASVSDWHPFNNNNSGK